MSVEVSDVSKLKSDAEFRKDFAGLADEEIERRGRLDETIFKMGDLLVQWQPTKATLLDLARDYGYKREALERRAYVALNITKADRNVNLSYSGHVEALKIDNVAARNELIAASSGRSANLVRVAVPGRSALS